MRNKISALIFCCLSFGIGFILCDTNVAHAQATAAPTKKKKIKRSTPSKIPTQKLKAPSAGGGQVLPFRSTPTTTSSTLSAPPASSTAVAAPAAPAQEKSPIKLLYIMDYEGPKVGSSLSTHQTPGSSPTTTAVMNHDVRMGYAISKANVLGVRGNFDHNLQTDPTDAPDAIVANDWRAYFSWGGMIDTPDIGMDAVLDVFAPTSDSSKKKGLITKFNIKNNWNFKTQLRNWDFSLLTIISPAFWEDPTGKKDFGLMLIPMITVDVAAMTKIYFELDLDAVHNYEAGYFDFGQADGDSFVLGPLFQLNSHLTAYPALRFYTGELSFKAATFFLEITAAL